MSKLTTNSTKFSFLRAASCLCLLPALVPAQALAQSPGNSTPAPASEAELLKQELQRMKSDYETRMRALERKIADMESRQQPATPAPRNSPAPQLPNPPSAPSPDNIPPPAPQNHGTRPPGVHSTPPPDIHSEPQHSPATTQSPENQSPEDQSPKPSAAKPAPPQPSSQQAQLDAIRQSFRRQTEIREMTNIGPRAKARAERVNEVLQNFVSINGYFRSGYGVASRGGAMEAFGIPSAPAKYRLGNEAENYGELIFSKTFYVPGAFGLSPSSPSPANQSGPVAQFNLRLSFFNPYTQYGSSANTDFGVPECWASIGNVIAAQPDLKFWAGSRFYNRYDLHLNDFFYYNVSGGGGGFEDLRVGPGKLALAWIGSANDSNLYSTYRETVDPVGAGNFSKWTVDLRYYDFAIGKGTGMLGLDFSRQQAGVLDNGDSAPGYNGAALNFIYTRNNIAGEGSLHSLGFQAGTGPAKTFTSGFETFSNADGSFIQPQSNSSWRVRALDQLVVNLTPNLALGSALIYQYTDLAVDGASQQWISAGVRPVYFFNDWLSLAVETGYDYVTDSPLSPSGGLFKFTLCPQVSWDEGFFGRPVLRAFVTWATWSNGLEGYVGGRDFKDRTSGLNFGVQMETWW